MSEVLQEDVIANAIGAVDIVNKRVLPCSVETNAAGNLLRVAPETDDIETSLDALLAFLVDTHNNFGFANVDTEDADYLYVGYLDKDGNWIIMRFDEATGEAMYASDFTSPDYATAWTARGDQTYRPFNVEF